MENREDEYKKEQLLGLATFSRAVAAVLIGVGLFIPFFKNGTFIPKQLIMSAGIGTIWLAFAADFVALAYKREANWTLRLYPIIMVIWIVFWLMK